MRIKKEEQGTTTRKDRITVLAGPGLLLVALIWGSSFPIGKICLESFPPLLICAVRCAASALLLLPFIAKKLKTAAKGDVLRGAALGACFFVAYIFQVIGLQYTASSKQAFLAALYVIMVPFLYWMLYRKSPDRYNLIAAAIVVPGIYLLTVTGLSGFTKGDGLTLISTCFFAVHILLIGACVKKTDALLLTFFQFAVSGAMAFVALAFFGARVSTPGWAGILSLAYIALACTAGAYGLQIVCQKYADETRASILLSQEAVFGVILSVLFLGDRLNGSMILGCALIFLAILTTETKWRFLWKKKTPPEDRAA